MMNNFYNVKLTDKEVYHILWLNKVHGLKPFEIVKQYNVSKLTISKIVNGKSRKDCYAAFMYYKQKHPRKIKTLFKE